MEGTTHTQFRNHWVRRSRKLDCYWKSVYCNDMRVRHAHHGHWVVVFPQAEVEVLEELFSDLEKGIVGEMELVLDGVEDRPFRFFGGGEESRCGGHLSCVGGCSGGRAGARAQRRTMRAKIRAQDGLELRGTCPECLMTS